MKQRRPCKPRNMAAKALRDCKLFAPKILPAKKGKGTFYSRKSRNANEPSGSYHFWLTKIIELAYGRASIVHA